MGYPQYAGAESSNQLYFFPPRRYRIDRQQVIFILISWASHKKKTLLFLKLLVSKQQHELCFGSLVKEI